MAPPILILKEFAELQVFCPRLANLEFSNTGWRATGDYDFRNQQGEYCTTFKIEITIPFNYPESLPRIREIGDQIPNSSNWHNCEKNGCCLSPDSRIFQELGKVNLFDWFRVFVVSFFANFLYRKKFGEYPEGEFKHNEKGIIQGYQELFLVSTIDEVILRIESCINERNIGRNEPCFCGSNIKFKNCELANSKSHRPSLNVPLSVLKNDLIVINKYLNKSKRTAKKRLV